MDVCKWEGLTNKTERTRIMCEERAFCGCFLTFENELRKKHAGPLFSVHTEDVKRVLDVKIALHWVLLSTEIGQWKKLGKGFWRSLEKRMAHLQHTPVWSCLRAGGLVKWCPKFLGGDKFYVLPRIFLWHYDLRQADVDLTLLWEDTSRACLWDSCSCVLQNPSEDTCLVFILYEGIGESRGSWHQTASHLCPLFAAVSDLIATYSSVLGLGFLSGKWEDSLLPPKGLLCVRMWKNLIVGLWSISWFPSHYNK